MNANQIAVWASLLGLGVAGCATHKAEIPQAWGGTVMGQLSQRAVVEKVDYDTREVTVKDEAGERTTVVAGPLVRNSKQIKKGDKVALEYQETVTILGMSGVESAHKDMYAPKYHYDDGTSDPFYQIDMAGETAVAILPTEQLPPGSEPTFREDGY